MTFEDALQNWKTAHSLNRRPRTVEFNAEIAQTITQNWTDPRQTLETITCVHVLQFAARVAHYCPSRWNAITGAIRWITPDGQLMKRRPLALRHFTPPTQQEFSRLLSELDRDPRSTAGAVVRFFATTGLRYSEAYALQWKDVTPDALKIQPENAKNGRARFVPLIPAAAAAVERLRAITGHTPHVLPRQNPKHAIRSACLRAGLTPLSFHSFRHLFATRCIESAVDLPTVARWLGHRDGGALLAKAYFHLLDEHSRTMAARVQI